MISLRPITLAHYEALHEIQGRVESFPCPSLFDFRAIMSKREGFVLIADGQIIGAVSFSDFMAEMDITVHIFTDPAWHGRFSSRRIYKAVFDYPFEQLGLPRVTAYLPKSKEHRPFEKVARYLKALGFQYEGTVRNRLKMPDGNLWDVEIYGLLKEERRW